MLAVQGHKGKLPSKVMWTRSASGFLVISLFQCYSTKHAFCVEVGASRPQPLHNKAYSVFLQRGACKGKKTASTCSE